MFSLGTYRNAAFIWMISMTAASEDCNQLQDEIVPPKMPEVALDFDLPGLLVSSREDRTKSTGATLFMFPEGAEVAYDARGGSVASSETSLFDQGSYSASIDAVVFAGGSTLGLAAGDGVRNALFRQRVAQGEAEFDAIPSVPTAVVYDFCGRSCAHNDRTVTPDHVLGAKLLDSVGQSFRVGRAGAGVSTTANKVDENNTFYGGQGAAVGEYSWGKVFVAVVLNPVGDVQIGGQSYSTKLNQKLPGGGKVKPGKNTTLSIVVTDVPLDRNQLKRLSVQLHTSMGGSIVPFHTYSDGDINFAVSTRKGKKPKTDQLEDIEFQIANAASKLMKQAIEQSVEVANRPVERVNQLPDRMNAPAPKLKVAAVQYQVDYNQSLNQVKSKIETQVLAAKAKGAELVVLPELFMLDLLKTGTAVSDKDQLERIADHDTYPLFDHVKALARQHNISILGGSSPRRVERGIVNTSILAFPDGKTVLQDKNFLTPDEIAWGWTTGTEQKVFDAPWGRTSILICYDSQFPTLSNSLADHRPEVLLVPSMTGADGFWRVRDAAEARSVEHHAFSVVTGTTGGAGRSEYTSQAAILTPHENGFTGKIAESKKNEADIIVGELDLTKLRASRSASGLYAGKHQKGRDVPVRMIELE